MRAQSQCAGEIEAVILFGSESANAVEDFHRLFARGAARQYKERLPLAKI